MIESAATAAPRRVAAALSVIVLVVGIVAASTYDDGTSIPEGGAHVQVDGIAAITRAGGGTRELRGGTTLGAGDVVEAKEGTFVVTLADGATIEGRARRADVAATRLTIGTPPDLAAGEALVSARNGTSITAAGSQVALQEPGSVVRVRKALGVRSETYKGTMLLDSAGQQRSVPALRRVDVPVLGRPAAAPTPLTVDATDPWDLRYLGQAIELTRTLDSFSRTLTGSLGPAEGRTPGFYEQLLPQLGSADGYGSALFADRRSAPQGETLVGAAIAALGDRGSFAERWRSVFSFRSDGADWGLVATDQGVAPDPLTKALAAAVNSAPLQFALGPAPAATPTTTPPPTTSAPPPATTAPPPPTTTSPTTPPTTAPPPVTTPPLLPPPTLPPPPETNVPVLDDLLGAVGGLVNGLLGGASRGGG